MLWLRRRLSGVGCVVVGVVETSKAMPSRPKMVRAERKTVHRVTCCMVSKSVYLISAIPDVT
jgi:hypothetical protein